MTPARISPVWAFFLLAVLAGCDRTEDANEDRTPPPSSSSSSPSSSSSSSSGTSRSPDEPNSLTVQMHVPAAGASEVSLVPVIQITFNQAILSRSFTSDLVTLDAGGAIVSGTLRQVTDRSFEFTPHLRLSPRTEFDVTVGSAMSESGLEHAGYSFSFTTAANIGATPQAVIDACMDERDIAMLAAVNEARSQVRPRGPTAMTAVAALRWNCQLRQAAQVQSDDMASNDFFSHTGSDGSSVGQRLSGAGYQWAAVGENLAAGQRTVAQVMSDLLNSEGHCRNIMASRVTEFGSAYTERSGTRYQRYWTQVFAAPWRE